MVTRTDISEKGFLQLIAKGSEEAFSALFYQYLPILQPFVVRFTKSSFAAEEVIQNTFIKIWLSREKLEDVENVKSWIFKYASNECLSYLRSQKQKDKVLLEALSSAGPNYQQCDDTAEAVKVNEINQLVSEAVHQLSSQRRKIYLLSRNDGMTIPEIALELQLSPNTVKNALVISLKSIRGYLSKNGYAFALLAFLS